MDLKVFNDVADTIVKLKMYPYFDISSYILMSMAVRDDDSCKETQLFSRRHPFASWLATMLMCFSASILANLLIGEPLLTPFKNHDNVLLATIVWYIINYSPFDIAYRIARFLPFKLIICMMKEVQRTRKIHEGVTVAYKLYPKAYLVCIIIGVIKGAGYTEMRLFERLVRGIWLPASNEFLRPSFVNKASVGISLFFLLEKLGRVTVPHSHLFLGAVTFLCYFKMSSLILGIHDPFVPFENVFCAIFMGGIVDSVRRAMEGRKEAANAASGDSAHSNNVGSDHSTSNNTADKKNE